jgi:hypothetical protein
VRQLSTGTVRCSGALAVAGLLVLAGCTAGAADGEAAPVPTVPETEVEPEADPQPEPEPGTSALRPPADGTDRLPDGEADPRPVGPAGPREQVSGDFPRWSGDVSRLSDARLITLESLDRLVLEFDGDLPSWRVRVTTGPLVEQPGRFEIDLEGDAVLEIRLVPATSLDRDAAEPMAAYEGPSHLVAGGQGVQEALLTADSSDILEWGVGVPASPAFAVGTLESPDRLVIDVLHGPD